MSRDTQVTIDGRVYLIPDIWLAGFCHSNGCTVQQAAGWWAYQTYLAEQEVKP